MHALVIIEAFDPVDDVELGKGAGVVAKQTGARSTCLHRYVLSLAVNAI